MTTFDSRYADEYDLLYAGKDYQLECNLIEAAAARFLITRPHTVLDVGCGTGRHAIELASRGYELTGVDLSDAMLSHAKQRSESLATHMRPRWLRGNARNFSAGGTFDMAVMMFAVAGYLTSNVQILEGLRNIRRHLIKGGLFACDFWYGPAVLTERPTDRIRIIPTEKGEVVRVTRTELDLLSHTADVTFRLWKTHDRHVMSDTTETHRVRYYFPQEFDLLLSVSGFELLSLSAFPSLDTPLTDGTWNAFAVAKAV